ncbi:MAG: biosynthetic-type acetolactate synthase large subunit [Alphaproteobacteria bacterium]|nr:biosynthetic-type acetolactate synthase large subunit [Alphaproteobacteria bacterium]
MNTTTPADAPQAQAGEARQLTGAEIIWEIVVAEGVDVVFGYPGGAIMPAYDAMARYPVRHVLVRHEQGATHAADGYARASGRVGVCVATSGPGATNLVTGLATAMLDSIPMVAITGQVPSTVMGTDAFQETDVLGVTIPVTKHGFLVTKVEDIAPTLREAFALARSGRPGPVLVDITKDAQNATCAFEDPGPGRIERPRIPRPTVTDAQLDAAAALIAQAERPVILAGHGIIQADARDELLQLVDVTDAPVTLTLLGLGVMPDKHGRNMGMMGMHGEPWVNKTIQQADLLIAVGMRFDDRVTGNLRSYAPKAKKIHLELDPAEIGKVVDVDVGLCGDAKEILQRLLPRLTPRKLPEWITHIRSMHEVDIERDVLNQDLPADVLLAPQVIHDLWKLTAGQAIVVTDVGQHQMWEAQYYKHGIPRGLITSGGLGTMGFALPAAMGAKFACPDKEVWVVCGDGGFQMTACELSTLAQEGIKVHVAIINNGYLGMVRQWQEFFYESRYVSTPMRSPDFVKLAEAHGLPALRVTERSQIPDAVARARAAHETCVVEFRVLSEDNVFPMVASGRDLDDMIRRPSRSEVK